MTRRQTHTESAGLCSNSRNRAFIDPDGARAFSVRAALKMCEACPIRKECAEAGLTAGTSLGEDNRAPASGVIQAGVVCRGDHDTAVKLAEIADSGIPRFLFETRPRNHPGDTCLSCGEPMVRWHRGVTPEGFVMHHGRGFCTNCRGAYREDLRRNPPSDRGLRKVIDRGRRSSPGRTDRVSLVQLSLF